MQNLEKTSQKITLTLLAGQSLFTASIIMGFTIGSIIAVQLANGNSQWTGVPATLGVVGAAMIAYPIGRLMDRVGRRIGLSIGYVIGILGTLVAALGVINQSLFIFLIGFFGLGLTRGVLDLGRYAAAEASPAHRRARAISWVILGGTVGSILGPSLIEVTNNLAGRIGLPGLSGPWFAAAIFLAMGLVLINVFLRPDPQVIGRQLAALEPESAKEQLKGGRPYRKIIQDPNALLATGTLIFAQVTMVAVMVVTPVHMQDHNHALGSISVVIMAHTLGMFGLSFVTGWLADKLGRTKVIISGGLILGLSCLMAPFSHGVAWLVVALFLLGLGWNFCFVAGSTLLTDVLRPEEKGRIQGLTDTLINIASGVGSISSGFAFAAFGFAAMSWFTIMLGLIPVILVVYLRTARHQLALEGLASN
jgi:MFS family permease